MTRRWRTVALAAALGLLPLVPAAGSPADRTEAEVAFTYGLAAFHRGDLDQAAELLRQAAAADPGHGDARYWLGLVHLQRGDGQAAARELDASRRAARPPAVAPERLAADLERARQLAAGREPEEAAAPVYQGEPVSLLRLPRWEGRLGIAAGSDSNPAVLPDDLPAVSPDGEILSGAESDGVASLDLRLAVYPFYDRGGWSLGLAADVREAAFFDLDGLDFERLSGVLQLAWGDDPLGYLVGPLGYTRVPFGDRRFSLLLQAGAREDSIDGDSFLSATEAALALTFREGRATATRLDLAMSDEDFEGADPGPFPRGGERASVGLTQYVYLGQRDRYLALGAAAGERRGSPEVESELFSTRAELSLPLGGRWHLYLVGALEEEDFDQLESHPLFPSFFADRPRRDDTLRVAATLSVAVRPGLFVILRGAHIDRDVDLGGAGAVLDLDHDRTVVTAGVRWFFAGGGGR